MILKFVLVQENSDATCNYNIPIPDGTTVTDFFDAVLTYNIALKQKDHMPQERGSIIIVPQIEICKYHGQITEFKDSFFDYKDHVIKKASANGGWGAMNYYLTV